MNPLTVAIMIIAVFSAVAGVFIAEALIVPRLTSRRDAFVAFGSGVVALIAFCLAVVLTPGYMMQVALAAPGTMVFVCTMGVIIYEAIFGFRQHDCS